MWKQLGLGLLCLFAVVTGAELRGTMNATVPLAAIKPWYRSAAEKERAVRIGAGLPPRMNETTTE